MRGTNDGVLHSLRRHRCLRTVALSRGQTAPKSGQYQEIGPRGGKGHEVTVVKGETLPPTTQKGSTFKIVDPTKNKSGK